MGKSQTAFHTHLSITIPTHCWTRACARALSLSPSLSFARLMVHSFRQKDRQANKQTQIVKEDVSCVLVHFQGLLILQKTVKFSSVKANGGDMLILIFFEKLGRKSE